MMATEEISLRQRGGTPTLDPPQEHRKPPEQGFSKFLWNSEKKQFLGRDATSWGKILLFYAVFYAAITALSIACWCVFYRLLDMHVPHRTLGDSVIKPGLTHLPDRQISSELVSQVDEFLIPYMRKEQSDRHLQPCSFNNHKDLDRTNFSCSQNTDSFGHCRPGSGYGYDSKSDSVCIFIKLNKIYGWTPEFYDDPQKLPTSMPEDLKNHIKTVDKNELRTVWVSCEGEQLRNVEYFPHRGFPEYYFPFINTKGYLNPLVAVHFKNVTENVVVKCRAWAKGFPRVYQDHISETRFLLQA